MKVHMLTALVLVQLFQVSIGECGIGKVECKPGSHKECETHMAMCRCRFFTCNDGSCTNDMRTCDAKHLTPCREGERMCKDGTCQNVELDCACEKACLFGRCVKSYASCTDYDVNPEETAEGKETPILVRTLAEIKRKAALNRIEACIPTYQFQCLKGATPCVFTFDVCDGYDDCDDGSDEFDCEMPEDLEPKVQTPKVQSPTVQSPKVQSPTVQSPTVHSPKVQYREPHDSYASESEVEGDSFNGVYVGAPVGFGILIIFLLVLRWALIVYRLKNSGRTVLLIPRDNRT